MVFQGPSDGHGGLVVKSQAGEIYFFSYFMINDGVEELPLTRHFPGLVGSVRDVQHLIRFVSTRSTIPDQVLGWWGRSRRGKRAPKAQSTYYVCVCIYIYIYYILYTIYYIYIT